MPIAATAQVVQALPEFHDPDLLIGADRFSDAGVYRLDETTAIVQSVDFFPPLVEDPYVYGQIAAANSMSDVYAMGAVPTTALNIVAFPDDVLDAAILERILAGGAERVAAAGAVIVGGHSVRDDEIAYGLAVTGIVDPARMMTNRGARPGDELVLTKRLGTGFITTALRAGACPDEVLRSATASMIELNRAASEVAVALGVTGATDVTGFGLAAHALEMARASEVTFTIELERLPLLPGAEALAASGHRTRANATNKEHVARSTDLAPVADADRLEFLFDPQTSGGLLLAVAADRREDLVRQCRAAGVEPAVIGAVGPRERHPLKLR